MNTLIVDITEFCIMTPNELSKFRKWSYCVGYGKRLDWFDTPRHLKYGKRFLTKRGCREEEDIINFGRDEVTALVIQYAVQAVKSGDSGEVIAKTDRAYWLKIK